MTILNDIEIAIFNGEAAGVQQGLADDDEFMMYIADIRKMVGDWFMNGVDSDVVRDEDHKAELIKLFNEHAALVRDKKELAAPAVKVGGAVATSTRAGAKVDKDFSTMSVWTKQVASNTKSEAVMRQIAGLVGGWKGSELVSALQTITQYASTVDLTQELGSLEAMTDQDILSWTNKNTKKMLTVGPYMVMKYLLQCNVLFKVIYEPVTKMNWIEWERNGIKVASCDRRSVQVTHKVNTYTDEEAWTIFLAGLEVNKKPLLFVDYPLINYQVIDLMAALYKIQKDPATHKLQFFPLDSHGVKLSTRGVDYITSIKKEIEKMVIHDTAADDLIERMVSVVGVVPPEISAFLHGSIARMVVVFNGMRDIIVKAAVLPVEKRESALSTAGATSDIVKAVAKVQSDRTKIRNVSTVGQYMQKNAGSCGASELPQAVDTMMKGFRIVTHMEKMGMDTTKKETVVHVYGVAYGHMEKPLAKKACKFVYYDTKGAKRSSADMVHGNVWDACGEYIIDDSTPTTVDDIKLAEMIGKDYTVTHAKVEKLLTTTKSMAVIKLNMEHLDTAARVDAFTRLVYAKTEFTYSQVVKFGKLHNPEAFLIASKNHVRKKGLAFDIRTVAMCISLANGLLTNAHIKGIRAPHRAVERGVKAPENTYYSVDECWEQLIKSLPVYWRWYSYKLKDGDISGGACYTNMSVGADENYDPGFAYDYDK